MNTRLVRYLGLALLFVVPAFGGCTDEAPAGLATADAVSTDLSVYTAGDDVIVTWSGLSGASSNRIALGWPAPYGCSASHYSLNTGGGTSGSITLYDVGAAPYDARAYNTGSTCVFRSAAFVVNPPGAPVLTTDLSTYDYDQNIVLSWTNLPGAQYEYVVFSPQGAANNNHVGSYYTQRWEGTHTHTAALSPGTWVARVFGGSTANLIVQSAPFTAYATRPVNSGATISPPAYVPPGTGRARRAPTASCRSRGLTGSIRRGPRAISWGANWRRWRPLAWRGGRRSPPAARAPSVRAAGITFFPLV